MNTEHSYALYYPRIEFQHYDWLCSAALIWDRIYRIVPRGYTPQESGRVKALTEAGDIGIPIHPDEYAARVADEFRERLENGSWEAAALVVDVPAEYARLHQDKVDVQLRDMIIAQGKAASHDQWLYVPTEFESLYMTYLAKYVSEVNGLQLLSDSPAAWTGSTYFRYDGRLVDYPRDDLPQQLAALVVRDFLPVNVSDIAPDDLLRFREKYRVERQRFLRALQQSTAALSSCDDAQIVRDHIEDLKKDIEAALKDYKASVQTLNILGWTGIKSVSFPVATGVAAELAGHALDALTLTIVSAVGIALGLVSGIADWHQKRQKLERDSDYSYLLHLRRNWRQCALYNGDYNYYLRREMEEFIND